jgi:DNA-directed RNA polymerase beta' subunit
LPKINFEGRAKFYVPEFTPYIKYRDDEINVTIKRGNIERGVFDKGTIGDDANGGLFHTIYAEKGAPAAIETLYNWQQIINTYIYYCGITFGIADVYVPSDVREKLNTESAKIIAASEEVTRQLDEGKLIPPIEMTLKDYYEEMQAAALEHGDEFIKPIMEQPNFDKTWLYKFIFSGSKGNMTNMTAIYASIGSIGLKGGRIPLALGGRTSVNFQRFSTDPISRGYCPNSFTSGISAILFPFAAMEARYELIEVALSTATAGTMNRNAVKNLEPIVVSNLRGSSKSNRTVQLLFGETGIDPRKVEKIQFPSIKMSTKDFETKYHSLASSFGKNFRHKEVQQELDQEFNTLRAECDEYRHIMLTLEAHQRRNFLLKDVARMPINPAREIQNIKELAKESEYKTQPLDPLRAIEMVDEYVTSLGYIWMNEIQRRAKLPIPQHLQNVTTMLRILIRSYLCTANLIRNNMDITMLEQVLDRFTMKMVECFIEYGTSVGIIAAESISEPITQFLLDAKHRSGLKKDKTNMIVRFDEILKNKATEEMDNPQMTLIPLKEFQDDRQKVMEIANHIEMLPLGRFVSSIKIFMEEFGKPEHPDFVNEKSMIQKFQTFTLGDQIPKDLISWCIRMELNREEMVLKSMKTKTIYLKLMEKFPSLFFVYDQSDDNIILRIYIRNVMFKRGSDIGISSIRQLNEDLKNCIIRGTEGISSAHVVSIPYTLSNDEGALETKKMWVIETDGTNLSSILENPYLQSYECNTSSISEIERLYGIEAARNKIVDELLTTEKHKANYEWATIYADEMAYNGRVTSIQRSGLGQRERNNVLLRASFGSPIQVIQQAAINNQTDHIPGMSAPLVVGTVPRFGTTFNDVMIDQESVRDLTVSDADLIEAI